MVTGKMATPAPVPPDCVIWGLGTGRHVRELMGRGRVLVLAIDLDPGMPEIARAVLDENPDLRRAVWEGRLEVVLDSPDGLARRFQGLRSCKMHVHLPALAIAPTSAQPLARLVERIHLEARNLERQAPRLRDNLRANVAAIASAPSVTSLAGRGRGHPAFVVAAGPSATASLSHLLGWATVGPIITVDTMLPVLAREAIPVHCAVTADPHPASRGHLAEGTDHVDVLAIQPYAYPEMVDAVAKRVVAAPRGDRLWESVAVALNIPLLDAPGTVLVYALQMAAILECDPVVVIGADLAHVDGRTHASGTAHGHAAQPLGTFSMNRRGERVPSTRELHRFQADVERHIMNSQIPHLAVDGGGAVLRGAQMLDLEQISARLPPTSPWGGVGAIRPHGPDAAADRAQELMQRLEQFDSLGSASQHQTP